MLTESDRRRLNAIQLVLLNETTKESPLDWLPIESNLGVQLPDDYKRFIDAYGPGGFAEFGFLDPFEWTSGVRAANESRLASLLTVSNSSIKHSLNFELWPSVSGLLCFGCDTDGGTLSWVVYPKAIWTIVYAEQDWEQVQICRMSFLKFVQRLLVGSFMPSSMLHSEYWAPQAGEVYRYRRTAS